MTPSQKGLFSVNFTSNYKVIFLDSLQQRLTSILEALVNALDESERSQHWNHYLFFSTSAWVILTLSEPVSYQQPTSPYITLTKYDIRWWENENRSNKANYRRLKVKFSQISSMKSMDSGWENLKIQLALKGLSAPMKIKRLCLRFVFFIWEDAKVLPFVNAKYRKGSWILVQESNWSLPHDRLVPYHLC